MVLLHSWRQGGLGESTLLGRAALGRIRSSPPYSGRTRLGCQITVGQLLRLD
jgi:hypothetical protein